MSESTEHNAPTSKATRHTGSCHCGAVRYECEVDASNATRCNCTVCTKLGILGARVPPGSLKFLAGEEQCSTYEFGGRVAKRYFCSHCGTHLFGRGHLAMLGGDFASINLQTLDDADPSDAKVLYWDGRHNNWQAGLRETPWPINA